MPAPVKRGHISTSLSEINITPFVDVVLVLLIIFMITAPVLQSSIEVNLPQTRTVRAVTQERAIVTIDRTQRLYLNDQLVNINALAEVLTARSDIAQVGVYVRADESVPWGVIARVLDTLRQSGIENASMVTRPLERSRRN